MSTSLRHAIQSLNEQLQHRQKERRDTRIASTRAENEHDAPLQATYALSPDVKAFFGLVGQAVERDRYRYGHPAGQPPASAPSPTADAATTDSTSTEASPANAAMAPAYKPAAVTNPATTPADTAALAYAYVVPGVHVQQLWELWKQHEALLPGTPTENGAEAVNPCAALLLAELNNLSQENTKKPLMAQGLLLKVKQSVQAFLDGRTNDSVTLLRNALHNDPHNHSILMLLSQIHYWLGVSGGVQNMMPEARDLGQRSTIHSDKRTPAQMAFYRYLAIVTESALSPERTLEWLRDSGLLNVDHLTSNSEGLMAERGIYLRAWYLLSCIPVQHWHEREFQNIQELVTRVIGGAAMYLAWLRTPLQTAATMNQNTLPGVQDIEKMLHTAQRQHATHFTALKQFTQATQDKPWLLRVRFLATVTAISPLPAFDQALLHFSLDGMGWEEGVTPDPELRATLGLRELSYWRLWAMVLTPYKDVRQPYLLPAEETVSDLPLLGSCEELLQLLAQNERELVKAHLWEDLKPWMVRWQVDHLLAASTGSNKPRTRFAPSLPPYTSLYRLWQDPPVTALLPSELITENARRGAFASLFEVTAAIEGASRLINDPVHGLVAAQKRALAAANRYNPSKFKSVAQEFGSTAGSGLLIAFIPIAMLGLIAAVINFSANWGQALGLILALGGVAGVVAINVKK